MQKITSFHQFILGICRFLSHVKKLATPILTPIFDQPLIYVNLYQHAKNQAISLICSGNMDD